MADASSSQQTRAEGGVLRREWGSDLLLWCGSELDSLIHAMDHYTSNRSWSVDLIFYVDFILSMS